jgi:hypothetical protein
MCSEDETRADFEDDGKAADAGWHRILVATAVALGWKKGHGYWMMNSRLGFLENLWSGDCEVVSCEPTVAREMQEACPHSISLRAKEQKQVLRLAALAQDDRHTI